MTVNDDLPNAAARPPDPTEPTGTDLPAADHPLPPPTTAAATPNDDLPAPNAEADQRDREPTAGETEPDPAQPAEGSAGRPWTGPGGADEIDAPTQAADAEPVPPRATDREPDQTPESPPDASLAAAPNDGTSDRPPAATDEVQPASSAAPVDDAPPDHPPAATEEALPASLAAPVDQGPPNRPPAATDEAQAASLAATDDALADPPLGPIGEIQPASLAASVDDVSSDRPIAAAEEAQLASGDADRGGPGAAGDLPAQQGAADEGEGPARLVGESSGVEQAGVGESGVLDGMSELEAVAAADLGAADGPSLDDPERLRAALEAVLLVVDTPTGAMLLAQVLGRPVDAVERALRDLRDGYDAAGRGLDLREVAGGWRLYTREDFAPYVERFVLEGQQTRLTQAALETLAVVAYRQPITRSRVSAIRGVNVDAVMRTLLSRGLVEECGSDSETGGGLYRTTPFFLERLGIGSLDELPSLAPLLPDTSQLDDVALST